MSIFTKIKLRKPGRNKFNLSHTKVLSCQMGYMIPVLCKEIVPGDKFRVSTECMVRFAPMLAPIMHRVDVKFDHFFVPNRIIWNQWEDFITKGREGTTTIVPPYINWGSFNHDPYFRTGSLADYFGLPVTEGTLNNNVMKISSLPFRAYQKIYNEYYRDQNLTPEIAIPEGSGEDDEYAQLLTMRKSAWMKDPFTAALPWPQRGPEVLIPMEGVGTSTDITYKNATELKRAADGAPLPDGVELSSVSGNLADLTNGEMARAENIEEVRVQNTSITLNALRYANKLQQWFENNARGGARYIEQILSHFGIKSSDARLQRPEYLGGTTQAAVISEVLATAQTEGGSEENPITSPPQGNMAGHGISVGRGYGFKRFFEEHGFVITIMRILPKTGYQQGIEKMWSREDTFDYFWPEFSHLGEQEIKDKEVWYDPAPASFVDGTFGYNPRYYEYKSAFNTTHGKMRTELSYWHMNRIFASKPVLNTSFVEADPTKRIFNITDPTVEDLYVQIYHKIDALRPMPYFGTPSL